MPVSRKLSLDKDVLSELESDELAQLAGGLNAVGAVRVNGTLVTCTCPTPTGDTCLNLCNVTGPCTYNACPTVPIDRCVVIYIKS